MNNLLKKIILEVILEHFADEDKDLNREVEEFMALPEFASVEAFAEFKYENDEETYSVAELQALSKNIFIAEHPELDPDTIFAPQSIRERVKNELGSYGLKFIPRKVQKQTRGFTAPIHGSNRYAGNHGGSGFETAFNRSKDNNRTYDASASDALPMGSKRRK